MACVEVCWTVTKCAVGCVLRVLCVLPRAVCPFELLTGLLYSLCRTDGGVDRVVDFQAQNATFPWAWADLGVSESLDGGKWIDSMQAISARCAPAGAKALWGGTVAAAAAGADPEVPNMAGRGLHVDLTQHLHASHSDALCSHLAAVPAAQLEGVLADLDNFRRACTASSSARRAGSAGAPRRAPPPQPPTALVEAIWDCLDAPFQLAAAGRPALWVLAVDGLRPAWKRTAPRDARCVKTATSTSTCLHPPIQMCSAFISFCVPMAAPPWRRRPHSGAAGGDSTTERLKVSECQ